MNIEALIKYLTLTQTITLVKVENFKTSGNLDLGAAETVKPSKIRKKSGKVSTMLLQLFPYK